MLHAYAKSAVAQVPQYLSQTSAAFARKKMSYYCKLCKICVNQGKPSFEDAHMYVYIYMYPPLSFPYKKGRGRPHINGLYIGIL